MNFLKKYWLLIFLAFLATVLLIVKILLKTAQTLPVGENSWKGITPNISTKNELEKNLGQPINLEKKEEQTILYYPSENEDWPAEIYVSNKNNKVELIKNLNPFSNENYQYFINKFGPPNKELFGPHQGAGFSVFVFLDKGVAIVSNPESGIVLEVWYFSPTTLENFLKFFGKELTLTPTERF